MSTQEYACGITKIIGQTGIKKWQPSCVLSTVEGIIVEDTQWPGQSMVFCKLVELVWPGVEMFMWHLSY